MAFATVTKFWLQLYSRLFEQITSIMFFQQDSARCHSSRVAMNVLNKNHIRTLPWSALSPDLNPIEHLWDELGRRVRMRVNLPESIDQFQRALTVEWNNIPQAFVMRLIGSMRHRCLAVINARGGHTRY